MKRKALVPACCLLVAGLLAAAQNATGADGPGISLDPVYEGLTFERPISLVIPPDGSMRHFLVEQTGKIKILPQDEKGGSAKVFLDLSDRSLAEKDFEEGLLGLAFHPDYAKNGKFYIYYSQQGPKRSVVSEMKVSADADKADPKSERILMEIQQPEWNHNSGNMLFGPEGYLYICVGDGGFKNGVHMLAQKLTRWNGKVLRIDVNQDGDLRGYGIPADNPFIDEPHAAPEIWAYGLRNPWGAWIDPETHLFWLADVGQNLWEEINLIERGGNYGWEYREGLHEFAPRAALMEVLGGKKEPKKGTSFVDPVFEYSHAEGLSITGGVVYRGAAVPDLKDHYIYGDWKFGTIWGLHYDAKKGEVTANHQLFKPSAKNTEKINPTAFCLDRDGELVILNWDGRLFRMASK